MNMYSVLIKLIVLATMAELGTDIVNFSSYRECRLDFKKAQLQIVGIDWKPISIFPKEAKRFLPHTKQKYATDKGRAPAWKLKS